MKKIVVTFWGWTNAGDVSAQMGRLLQAKTNSIEIAKIKGFFEYTSCRPAFTIHDGIVKEVKEPATTVWVSKTENQLFISQGPEPTLNWHRYCDEFFGLLKSLEIERIFSIGSFYDRVTHRMEQKFSIVVSHDRLKKEFEDLVPVNYEGPGSIHSYLIYESAKRGIESVTIWNSVPPYIVGPVPYYPAILSCCEIIKSKLNIDFNTSELREVSKRQYEELEARMRIDPKLHSLVEEIEKEVKFTVQ